MKAKDSQSQTASKDHQSQTANKDNQSQTAGKDHQSKIANELGFPKQGSGDAVINQISLLPGLLCRILLPVPNPFWFDTDPNAQMSWKIFSHASVCLLKPTSPV